MDVDMTLEVMGTGIWALMGRGSHGRETTLHCMVGQSTNENNCAGRRCALQTTDKVVVTGRKNAFIQDIVL